MSVVTVNGRTYSDEPAPDATLPPEDRCRRCGHTPLEHQMRCANETGCICFVPKTGGSFYVDLTLSSAEIEALLAPEDAEPTEASERWRRRAHRSLRAALDR